MNLSTKSLVLSATPWWDESFVGYLIRLTEMNRYGSPSWILQLAGLGKYFHKVAVAFDEDSDLGALARLTRTPEDTIRSIHYSLADPSNTKRNRLRDYKILGHPVPRTAIRAGRPKVCPACLLEHGYCRTQWDLIAVTACPIHKCLLMDECPHCNRRIPLSRQKLSECHCEFDWRRSEPILVDETELELSRRIYACIGKESQPSIGGVQMDNLRGLSLKDLLSVLFFFASQYFTASDHNHKRLHIMGFGTSMRNETVHHFLCKAAWVFRDWPTNYFSFLHWRIENLRPSKEVIGVHNTFGNYWKALFTQFRSPSFDFLRVGFEEFITKNWEASHISRVFRLSKHTRDNKRFVSKEEARQSLGVSSDTIVNWLKTGQLTGMTRKNGRSKIFLIEAASVVELKTQREDLIDTKDTAKRLGLTIKQTAALTRAHILIQRDLHRLRTGIFYSISDIDHLLARIASTLSLQAGKPGKRLTFLQVVSRLKGRKMKVAHLIMSIVNGQIRPCTISKGAGFQRFMFHEQDVAQFEINVQPHHSPNYLNVAEASKVLTVSKGIVRFLVKNNLIGLHNEGSRFPIRPASLTDFSNHYVLTPPLARSLGTSAPYLTKLLEKQGVNPIKLTKMDRRPSYFVYAKNDVDLQELEARISMNKRDQRQPENGEHLDIKCAADFLDTTPNTISELMTNGVLLPSSRRR